MVATSSSLSSRCAAVMIGSTWSGRRKPMMAPSTAGLQQRPGDRDRARGRVMTVGDRPQPLHQREVLGQLRLLEALAALAPVVLGQLLDPLAGHRAGQQAGAHRRVDDHADPLALGEGQQLLLDLARDQRVGRLQRLDRARSAGSAAAGATLKLETPMWRTRPCCLELGERRPALLDLLVGDRPVDLVEVDRIDSEPREAAFELAPQRVAAQALDRRAARPLGLSALREHVRALARDRRARGRRPPRSARSRTAQPCRSSSRPARARGGWPRSSRHRPGRPSPSRSRRRRSPRRRTRRG